MLDRAGYPSRCYLGTDAQRCWPGSERGSVSGAVIERARQLAGELERLFCRGRRACQEAPTTPTTGSRPPISGCDPWRHSAGGLRRGRKTIAGEAAATCRLFSLRQHQPDAHLLQRLRQPGDLRLRGRQPRIRATLANPRPGRRQHIQRALLGNRPKLHDPQAIHTRALGRLNRAELATQQPDPELYFCEGDRNRFGRRPPLLPAEVPARSSRTPS